MKLKFPLLIVLNLFLFCCTESNPIVGPEEEVEMKEGPVQIQEDPLAFPGAEGFGKDASGGRGGKIIFVDNLNDSGTGSLRKAVDEVGPRIILFRVSGIISLKSRLLIRNNDITIAGQSAPGDGICIKDYPVVIGADNVIIRYLRFRLGDEAQQEADALEGRFQKNIIIDHCSMSWSSDECVTFYANENTTVQWCLISESLKSSVHVKGNHGYGGIWGGKNASFHHNLLAHHDSRNPRLGEEAGKAFALTDLVDLRNNVIYNWGGNSCYGGEGMNVNIVNCYYKPGPATTKKTRIVSIDKNTNEGTEIFDTWGKFYIDGNFIEGSTQATNDNWTYGVINQFHSKYTPLSSGDLDRLRMNSPHDIGDNVTTHSAQEAYTKVLEYVGANLVRDVVDIRILQEVKTGTYTFEGSNGSTKGIIDSQNDVGGFPELTSTVPLSDSDNDGMPDDWEISVKLDPLTKDASGRDLSSAYDNIEVYVNSLVKETMEGQK